MRCADFTSSSGASRRTTVRASWSPTRDETMKKDRDYEIAMSNIKETRLEIEF
jgi:hypothetical protein